MNQICFVLTPSATTLTPLLDVTVGSRMAWCGVTLAVVGRIFRGVWWLNRLAGMVRLAPSRRGFILTKEVGVSRCGWISCPKASAKERISKSGIGCSALGSEDDRKEGRSGDGD
jgi:hypothetical protein